MSYSSQSYKGGDFSPSTPPFPPPQQPTYLEPSSPSIPPPQQPTYLEPRSPSIPPSSSPSTIKEKKEQFHNILKHYLDTNPVFQNAGKTSELEIRFGTNTKIARPLSKIDYDNVVKQLLACGFHCENLSGVHLLRIIDTEFLDKKTGRMKDSNIRAEIVGTDMIQEYCRTNSIQKLLDMPSTTHDKMKFTQKESFRTQAGEYVNKLDMDDFNFRVSLQTEKDYNTQTDIVRKIVAKWNDNKKKFRCMNRVRFSHPDYPLFADISIVKMSKRSNRTMMPYYTIQEADVFNGIETYEIELEVDNRRVGTGTPFHTPNQLMEALRKCIRIVLSGLQTTHFPISYPEQESVLDHYIHLIHGPDSHKRHVKSRDFIGPSSFTLQIENILPIKEDESKNSKQINIRTGYTVTDKADGDRCLLYIHDDGKIYLIDTNMRVLFTGAKTTEKSIFHSLLDGEHIPHDKNGNSIHLYAAFDVYYINKKSMREYAFYPPPATEEELDASNPKKQKEEEAPPKKQYRCKLLNDFISLLKPVSVIQPKSEVVLPAKSTEFVVQCKEFYPTTPHFSIFDGCSKILSNIADGHYQYNTDGLIFTPADLAIGAMHPGGPPGPLHKSTWDYSFKWKPAKFNTIDFLVSIKKDKTGKDEVHNAFQEGRNMQGIQEIEQYKTLILLCGFDEKSGYVNPFQDVLDDIIPKPFGYYDENEIRHSYKAVPFQPTEPYDPAACFCKMKLKEVGSKMMMMTQADEVFDEDMIVEFEYNPENADGMKWVPLRVRYDKTAELNAGGRNYGNAYHVANSNWRSIHYPITDTMISSGKDIPEYAGIEEVYYSRSNEESSTEALRNFHNLFVKKNLILGVAQKGDTLIDYAVGKAGDLAKWTRAHLSFVFGIDISKDNIHNKKDGACARYLKERYQNTHAPRALFLTGDSQLNIRSGQAFTTEKEKNTANAVFGRGPKDQARLGKAVYQQYGVAESGFQVSSCQFALHYFFENKRTFHSFIRNVAECTHLNGYFIGTCYDGMTVFNLLKNKTREEGVTIMKNGKKMFEMIKQYDQTGFPDDELSLGYAINVFQESINQVFREYLVNFDFLIRIMEDYGFRLITKEEANQMNLPDGTGMFSQLFADMETELKMNPRRAADYRKSPFMSPEEKRISFMNRYFVFKKVLAVNVKKISDLLLKNDGFFPKDEEEQKQEEEKPMEEIQQFIEEQEKKQEEPTNIVKATTPTVLKRKKKFVLKNFVTIPENTPPESDTLLPRELEVVNITTADIPAAAPTMKIKVKKTAAVKK